MNNLKELLLPNTSQNYTLIVKSSFECYLSKYMEVMATNLLSLIEASLVHKKSNTSKKALQLFVKLRSDNSVAGSDLINVF